MSDVQVLEDTIVPAGRPWSRRIAKGDVLRLVDIEGQQAIDFLCYNADDPKERYHAPNTIKIPGQIYLGKGASLWSVKAKKMMTIIKDTCGGHDTIFGCCSFALDEVRYGKTNPRCCQKNFEDELARHGLGPRDIVPNVNFFMRCRLPAMVRSRSSTGIRSPATMSIFALIWMSWPSCPIARKRSIRRPAQGRHLPGGGLPVAES